MQAHNKLKERQGKLIYTQEHLYIHDKHTRSIDKNIYMPTDKMCIYWSINKQYMKGLQK